MCVIAMTCGTQTPSDYEAVSSPNVDIPEIVLEVQSSTDSDKTVFSQRGIKQEVTLAGVKASLSHGNGSQVDEGVGRQQQHPVAWGFPEIVIQPCTPTPPTSPSTPNTPHSSTEALSFSPISPATPTPAIPNRAFSGSTTSKSHLNYESRETLMNHVENCAEGSSLETSPLKVPIW